ncbi:MAG: helix-hairpin-helix domain-containing protein [Bacteroidaceae bacterium]|nr:helix-hairpin-helix domain-containing protein [Bacteroidaceae bacterium]
MWKDLFYFSKSDRRAISFFVLVIAVTAVLRVSIPRRSPLGNLEEALQGDSTALFVAADVPKSETQREPVGRIAETPRSGNTTVGVEAGRNDMEPLYRRRVKYPQGTVLDLNEADTAQLVMVPGIGSYFACRITEYRDRLGGFYSTGQLLEINRLPDSVIKWFVVADTFRVKKISVNRSTLDQLSGHPYISYRMAKALTDFRRREGAIKNPAQLALLEEFGERDLERVVPYLDFGN